MNSKEFLKIWFFVLYCFIWTLMYYLLTLPSRSFDGAYGFQLCVLAVFPCVRMFVSLHRSVSCPFSLSSFHLFVYFFVAIVVSCLFSNTRGKARLWSWVGAKEGGVSTEVEEREPQSIYCIKYLFLLVKEKGRVRRPLRCPIEYCRAQQLEWLS